MACLIIAAGSAAPASAQQIFHSTQSANLQTTDVLRGGNWLFEISHRFLPPISDGADALWGFDGPVLNRFGLSYSPVDGVLLGVQRSNFDDNLELNAKALVLESGALGIPVEVGVMGGAAWNTDPALVEGTEDGEAQYYVQLIVDALVAERFAVGVVPTYLRNPRIEDFETLDAIALGLHGQFYVTEAMSVVAEWIFSEEIAGRENDSGTFGMEFETRGHFFKLLVTNQPRMNPTQYLGGSSSPFEADELRLGFNITRLLPF